MRSTDAIIDRDQFKGRKYTYFHGIKMKKSSKARIGNAETTALEKKCRLCIDIVENATREAAQRMPPADEMENEMAPEVVHGTSSAEAENRMLADNTEAASADELGLVFSLFHSLPELDGLDSIYKKRLFFELRIRRFAAGSTVRVGYALKPQMSPKPYTTLYEARLRGGWPAIIMPCYLSSRLSRLQLHPPLHSLSSLTHVSEESERL